MDAYNILQITLDVAQYFITELPTYSLVKVQRMSDYKEDAYLYGVIAKRNDGEYACWTCWNQSTKSLNFGHYGLDSLEHAQRILDEHYAKRG